MRFLVFIILLLSPMPALALSCMAPNLARSFDRFAAAEETYVIVHGRVTLDMTQLPKAKMTNQNPPEMTRILGDVVGKSLNGDGFRFPFDQQVTLEVSCLGPWCGSIENGSDVLAFLRKVENGYTLAVTPCGGSVFSAPKPAQLRQVRKCFRNGTCADG